LWSEKIRDTTFPAACYQKNINTPHHATGFDIVSLQNPSGTDAYCSQQQWRCESCWDRTMWHAFGKQGPILQIFMEGTRTNHSWKLQNEVIQGAGHVDTTFFQQDGALPHTVNIILDVLHDVFCPVKLISREFWV
jgi:hypothetical protein